MLKRFTISWRWSNVHATKRAFYRIPSTEHEDKDTDTSKRGLRQTVVDGVGSIVGKITEKIEKAKQSAGSIVEHKARQERSDENKIPEEQKGRAGVSKGASPHKVGEMIMGVSEEQIKQENERNEKDVKEAEELRVRGNKMTE